MPQGERTAQICKMAAHGHREYEQGRTRRKDSEKEMKEMAAKEIALSKFSKLSLERESDN